MTAYNRENFIAEAIESVLASTFTDFELIIVDDSSADNTLPIAQKYAAADSRIRLVCNPVNLGQFANRNKAAQLAKGKYIKYLDSDDTIFADSLRIMLQAMEQYPSAGIALEFNHCTTLPEGTVFPFELSAQQAYLWHFEKGGILFPGPSQAIYKSDIFKTVGGFPLEFGLNGDFALHLNMAANSNTVILPPALTSWRRHTGQVISDYEKDIPGMMRYKLAIYQMVLASPQCPLDIKQIKRVQIAIQANYLRRAILSFLFKGKIKEFFTILSFSNIPFYRIPLLLLPLRLNRN